MTTTKGGKKIYIYILYKFLENFLEHWADWVWCCSIFKGVVAYLTYCNRVMAQICETSFTFTNIARYGTRFVLSMAIRY